MTKEKLIEEYLPLVDYVQGKMIPTQRDNATKCANISIEYAISVLEEVANPEYQIISDGQCGVISIPQSTIYNKITELKKLINDTTK